MADLNASDNLIKDRVQTTNALFIVDGEIGVQRGSAELAKSSSEQLDRNRTRTTDTETMQQNTDLEKSFSFEVDEQTEKTSTQRQRQRQYKSWIQPQHSSRPTNSQNTVTKIKNHTA
jgi:hypothetical protein